MDIFYAAKSPQNAHLFKSRPFSECCYNKSFASFVKNAKFLWVYVLSYTVNLISLKQISISNKIKSAKFKSHFLEIHHSNSYQKIPVLELKSKEYFLQFFFSISSELRHFRLRTIWTLKLLQIRKIDGHTCLSCIFFNCDDTSPSGVMESRN